MGGSEKPCCHDAVPAKAGRIAATLNARGVPCPSAHDRARNSHRSGEMRTDGTTSILRNPRYTGNQVWNKQRATEVLT
ncbi:hypothetical protein FLW53_36240 [Microbispora sp. SCL1-1]|nr:recombinase family protein [Microbispora sp. CL1-1]NJP29558.1 hypothetical protein [Microbispora sp. CL1-1]TQS05023.1 hypothetical protein FLW53_36240 [Microbispora sp. SCL1-1]